jgi:hypothetical protein
MSKLQQQEKRIIEHLIRGPKEHSIIFDANENIIKQKLIDFIAIWQHLDLKIYYFEESKTIKYRLDLQSELKDVRELINFLLN